MSSVYRARDRLLERHVALKILHEHSPTTTEYVERFRREARAVAQLSHPNIVTVIDRGEHDGRQFIVFEYVDGENLKELVEARARYPCAGGRARRSEIARALAFAHEHGLVHRDVKPQNVLLNGDGRAKVTDFGIARSLDVEHGVTQTGTVLGTRDYIAPEQARGEPVDAPTDVYSLGVVLYELLTGEVPFDGDNFVAVALQHVNEPPPSILDAPARLCRCASRARSTARSRRTAATASRRWTRSPPSSRRAWHELAGGPRLGRDHDRAARRRRCASSAAARRAPRRSHWPAARAGARRVLLHRGERRDRAAPRGRTERRGGNGSVRRRRASRFAASARYDPAGDDRRSTTSDAPTRPTATRRTYWRPSTTTPTASASRASASCSMPAAGSAARSAIASDTPGFNAEIQASDSPSGGCAPTRRREDGRRTTTFALQGKRAATSSSGSRAPVASGSRT